MKAGKGAKETIGMIGAVSVAALALATTSPACAAAPSIRRRRAGATQAFDVHEGTSYSVSVSPDGQWLAFDLQGSLWVSRQGGAAKRITDYFNDAHLPVWSPDGSRLAYYAYRDGDYDLWTVRPDGSDARQLTHGEDDDRDPAWSPDGKTVAFASDRDGSYDIWAVDVASGATRQITRCARGPRPRMERGWPDHRIFRYGRRAERHLHRPASGGEATALRAPSGAHYDAPSYGPKGELAYVCAGQCGQPSGDRRQAGQRQGECLSLPCRLAGGSAYYISDGLIRRRSGTVTTVPFSARLEATKPEYIRAKRDFTSTAPRRVLGIDHPTLSPDGQRIAFAALGDLWLVSSQGGKPEQLTHDAALEADAAWSPDGKFWPIPRTRAAVWCRSGSAIWPAARTGSSPTSPISRWVRHGRPMAPRSLS
jgi:WD40 repeat protein